MRILVIDDDTALLPRLAQVIADEGYTVDTAADGITGIRLALERRPDLVLCDIVMPHPNGFEVLAALRRNPATSSIPVVFLTGAPEAVTSRKGHKLAADDYLLKPFSRRQLAHVIEARLARLTYLRREAERRLLALRDSLSGSMPEDVLTPLAAMVGLSSFLRDNGAAIPPELICEIADGIMKGGQRLEHTLSRHRLFAELEMAERAPETFETFGRQKAERIGDLVRATAGTVASRFGRDQDISVDAEDVSLLIAPEHLRFIVEELTARSCLASRLGDSVVVSCQRLSEEEGLVRFTAQGIGISAENLKALVEPSEEGHEPPEEPDLSASIARRLVRLYGGRIEMQVGSDNNAGVYVYLPLTRESVTINHESAPLERG
jgi:two-component system sensor histidine kinase/response regulator